MREIILITALSVCSICKIKAQQPTTNTYPKITGYISIVNPIVAFDKNGPVYNFTDYYNIGFPCGINILKSDKFGFSFEVTPFIKVVGNSSKASNFLFHPGLLFRQPHGLTIVTRMAFETSGRYGTTVVLNKIFKKTPFEFRWNNFIDLLRKMIFLPHH